MQMLKKQRRFKLFLLLLFMAGLMYAGVFISRVLPILSGYGTKVMCSCVYVGNRAPDHVLREELGRFPFSLGTFQVNNSDSSVTGNVFGMAKRKAIYRTGLGCTLLSELSETEVRSKATALPVAPVSDTTGWHVALMDTVVTTAPSGKLGTAVDYAFKEKDKDSLRRTRAIVVVHKGKIVAEQYAPGFNRLSRLPGWSMTKSITNALTGILVGQVNCA